MDRARYLAWIGEVCSSMSQTEFARQIRHYEKNKNGEKICRDYHRNAVRNWIREGRVPEGVEVFISIALLDFDRKHPGSPTDPVRRNERYQYVSEKMSEILGQNFYGRNIHDALLIQVCRNVISFEEVLELEPVLEQMIRGRHLTQEDKTSYALQSETRRIENQFLRIETKEDIMETVRQDLNCFCTGIRTLGERLKNCYEKRERYEKRIPLSDAVTIYAPNYRDSFNRIFTDTGITRRWLLDLCVHLRFSREELQYVLANAHLARLSDDPGSPEAYYREGEYEIGSVKWYQAMEERPVHVFPAHYAGFRDMGANDKLAAGLLLGCCIENIRDESGFPPADYILESFTVYEHGKAALRKLKDLLQDRTVRRELCSGRLPAKLVGQMRSWEEYLQSGSFNSETETSAAVYRAYAGEFSAYSDCRTGKIEGEKSRKEAECLHFLAAMLYTVFTGKYYRGRMEEADLQDIKEQLRGRADNWEQIYYFLNHFFVAFLGRKEPEQEPDGRFFVALDSRKTVPMNLGDVRTYLCKSYMQVSAQPGIMERR